MFGPEYHKIHTAFKRDSRNKIDPTQYAKDEFAFLDSVEWRWTEKVDGTNIRIHWDAEGNAEYSIGGRTDRASIPAGIVSYIRESLSTKQFEDTFGRGTPITLYGEGYGAGIQKGGNYSPVQRFVLFDVRAGEWLLKREDVESVAEAMGLDIVPEVARQSLRTMVGWMQDEVRWPGSQPNLQSRWGGVQAEGFVGVPAIELKDRGGNRIITKLKFKDFRELL